MTFTRYLLLGSVLWTCATATAQTGCTDPAANNYNPAAVTNDGSCTYPVTRNTPVLRGVLSSAISESSGLEWTDGKLWTHNDSGNPPDIFSIDTADGHTLQTVIIDNYPNTDWEDITADSNYIYVGDHGNNDGSRTDLKVLKIAKSDITSGAVVHVNAQAISFSYTDQTSYIPSSTNNFDCEALISIRDSLYIFTKDRGDLSTRVYKMPKVPGSYALTPYTNYHVNGLITGADYNAATNEIILIGYFSGHANSFLWFLNDFQGDRFFSGNKRRIEIGNGMNWQTEGVAWISANRYFISNEYTSSVPQSLFISSKDSNKVSVSVLNTAMPASCSVYPNPASAVLYVSGLVSKTAYTILNSVGQAILNGSLSAGANTISITGLSAGSYSIEMRDENKVMSALKFEKK